MTPSKRNMTTKVQDDILHYWKDYEKENGCPPTLYSAAKALNYKGVSSIQATLERLVKKGLMKKEPIQGMQGWHTYQVVSDKQTN
jgi:SOS-response transcriptional repressor LexA